MSTIRGLAIVGFGLFLFAGGVSKPTATPKPEPVVNRAAKADKGQLWVCYDKSNHVTKSFYDTKALAANDINKIVWQMWINDGCVPQAGNY